MFNPIIAFDQKIIKILTRFSHRVQKQTGITNYFFVRIGLGLSVIALVVISANFFNQFLRYKSVVIILFLAILLLFDAFKSIKLTFKAEENIMTGEQVKIEEKNNWGLRFFWIMVTVYGIFVIYFMLPVRFLVLEIVANLGIQIGRLIYLYFLEVSPLPPGKSKVRQWADKLLSLFSGQPEPEPVPVPVKPN